MKMTYVILLMTLAATSGVTQQAPASSPSPQEKAVPRQRDAALSIEGEISRVDDKRNVFWLKISDGREMQFSFTPETPVSGSPGGASTQGLRDAKLEKGMHLKVEYDNVGGANVVTKMEIQPAKG